MSCRPSGSRGFAAATRAHSTTTSRFSCRSVKHPSSTCTSSAPGLIRSRSLKNGSSRFHVACAYPCGGYLVHPQRTSNRIQYIPLGQPSELPKIPGRCVTRCTTEMGTQEHQINHVVTRHPQTRSAFARCIPPTKNRPTHTHRVQRSEDRTARGPRSVSDAGHTSLVRPGERAYSERVVECRLPKDDRRLRVTNTPDQKCGNQQRENNAEVLSKIDSREREQR